MMIFLRKNISISYGSIVNHHVHVMALNQSQRTFCPGCNMFYIYDNVGGYIHFKFTNCQITIEIFDIWIWDETSFHCWHRNHLITNQIYKENRVEFISNLMINVLRGVFCQQKTYQWPSNKKKVNGKVRVSLSCTLQNEISQRGVPYYIPGTLWLIVSTVNSRFFPHFTSLNR